MIWVCVGGFGSAYFIFGMWDKWDSSPTFVSIQTTSLPIPEIPFPAVSICSVNKLEENKLHMTMKKLKDDQDQ